MNFHNYQIEDNPLQESEDLNRLTFEPGLFLIYYPNAFWKLSTSASMSNQFGTISNLHYAHILKNYRNIQRINAPLPQKFNQTLTGRISYRNPVESLFWNIIYTQIQSENNLLYQTRILENGATELQAIKQDNDRLRHSLSIRAGKYLSELNTNVALNANYSLQKFQQILNTEITDIENQSWGIGGKIETDFTDWFNTKYQTNRLFSKNQIQSQSNTTITQKSHLLNLNFYPEGNQYFAIKTEYIENKLFREQVNFFFTDLVYRFTWKKKNLDFEVQWNNIFNTENYRTVNVRAFSYEETNFRLRPRQMLFKVRLSL